MFVTGRSDSDSIRRHVTPGVPKVILASSRTTYGVVFANTPREPEHFLLDEG